MYHYTCGSFVGYCCCCLPPFANSVSRLSVEQIVEATAALQEAEDASRRAREEAERLALEEEQLDADEVRGPCAFIRVERVT